MLPKPVESGKCSRLSGSAEFSAAAAAVFRPWVLAGPSGRPFSDAERFCDGAPARSLRAQRARPIAVEDSPRPSNGIARFRAIQFCMFEAGLPYGNGKCTCDEIRRMIEEGIIPGDPSALETVNRITVSLGGRRFQVELTTGVREVNEQPAEVIEFPVSCEGRDGCPDRAREHPLRFYSCRCAHIRRQVVVCYSRRGAPRG